MVCVCVFVHACVCACVCVCVCVRACVRVCGKGVLPTKFLGLHHPCSESNSGTNFGKFFLKFNGESGHGHKFSK